MVTVNLHILFQEFKKFLTCSKRKNSVDSSKHWTYSLKNRIFSRTLAINIRGAKHFFLNRFFYSNSITALLIMGLRDTLYIFRYQHCFAILIFACQSPCIGIYVVGVCSTVNIEKSLSESLDTIYNTVCIVAKYI